MINWYTIKKSYAILALILLVTFSFNACTKEEYPLGSITVTTAAPTVGFIIRTAKGSDNITIDWGDGKRSYVNDAIYDELADEFRFFHEYSDTTARNIVITGNITKLNCNNNQLTSLDLSMNNTLVELKCSKNQLTKLDVSSNITLLKLNCSNNQLTNLDVSRNTVLIQLECDLNQLASLDVNKNTSLKFLSCVSNQITVTALNDLFKALPDYSGLDYNEGGVICISRSNPGSSDNPGIFDCDRSIAEEKGWDFMYY